MGKLKRIRVRKATLRDIGLFKKLWGALLEEQSKAGSLVVPNEHNLDFMSGVFESYVEGDLDGVVLFVSDAAVLMYGDCGSPMQYSIGDKVAYGFGQYVDPDHRGEGILDAMAKEAFTQLTDMGFDAMLGNTMTTDTHGREAYARVVEQNGLEVQDTGESPNFVKLSKE
jgi:GNAT superfamily N-acetyltransferase